jgi:hypothetical protein
MQQQINWRRSKALELLSMETVKLTLQRLFRLIYPLSRGHIVSKATMNSKFPTRCDGSMLILVVRPIMQYSDVHGFIDRATNMLSILEYLYTNTRKLPASKYNIATNTLGIKQQRPDRVNLMIDSLEKNGYITSVNTTSNVAFYKIT